MADLAGLIQAIEQAVENAAQQTAQEVADRLGEGFINAVLDFYGSYSPTPITWMLTPRTYNFTGASNYARGENLVTGGGKKYDITLKVGTNYVPGEPYAKQHGWNIPGDHSKEDIISNSWNEGSHGGYGFSTPPKTMMTQTWEQIRGELPSIMRSHFHL